MKDLKDFINPQASFIRPMTIRVLDKDGELSKIFNVPQGFQLERYVDSLYPNNEFMVYYTNFETNVSVLENNEIIEIYVGEFK